ncbi:hypothetical protein LXL04_002864 [Taraxacum kok-saghyz]
MEIGCFTPKKEETKQVHAVREQNHCWQPWKWISRNPFEKWADLEDCWCSTVDSSRERERRDKERERERDGGKTRERIVHVVSKLLTNGPSVTFRQILAVKCGHVRRTRGFFGIFIWFFPLSSALLSSALPHHSFRLISLLSFPTVRSVPSHPSELDMKHVDSPRCLLPCGFLGFRLIHPI